MTERATATGSRMHTSAVTSVPGLTIETVSRQMTHLRTAGIVALPGGRAITVLNRATLEQRAIVD